MYQDTLNLFQLEGGGQIIPTIVLNYTTGLNLPSCLVRKQKMGKNVSGFLIFKVGTGILD